MNRVSIRKVNLLSALKFGCVLGALFSLVPSIVLALLAKWIIAATRALLESWQNLEITSILGQSVRVNLIERLGLLGALKTLRDIDGLAWFAVVLIVLVLVLLGGAIWALIASANAALYNLVARFSGGIEVELANDAPRARLTGAALRGGEFVLPNTGVRLGRDPNNNIVLASNLVAPAHAEITRWNERWIIRDLGAPGGTFVNDRPIRENLLKDGFHIRLGDVELVFRQE